MSKRRVLFLLLSIPLLLLLLLGGTALFYLFASPVTAQVHLQPATRRLQNAATLTMVTGQPDSAQQQIAGARLLSATTTQTMTQPATGKGQAQAAPASGIIKMIAHIVYGSVSETVGTVLTGSDGVTIVSDQAATAYIDAGGFAYFRAHVTTPGAAGNFPSGAFHAVVRAGLNSAEFYNVTPFTGGQDAGSYSFAQSKDIVTGEQTLTTMTTLGTLAILASKLSAEEQWAVPPACTPRATANTTPGQRVKNFQVTVTVTCSGEVYDAQAAKAVAAQQLTTIASSELGADYQLSGQITTSITSVQVTEKQQGILSVSLFTQGTWVFQFTQAQKQLLARLVSGKSTAEAQKLLTKQTNIARASITIEHGFWLWNTLPANIAKISIIIQ